MQPRAGCAVASGAGHAAHRCIARAAAAALACTGRLRTSQPQSCTNSCRQNGRHRATQAARRCSRGTVTRLAPPSQLSQRKGGANRPPFARPHGRLRSTPRAEEARCAALRQPRSPRKPPAPCARSRSATGAPVRKRHRHAACIARAYSGTGAALCRWGRGYARPAPFALGNRAARARRPSLRAPKQSGARNPSPAAAPAPQASKRAPWRRPLAPAARAPAPALPGLRCRCRAVPSPSRAHPRRASARAASAAP